jgi:hypothetical protein
MTLRVQEVLVTELVTEREQPAETGRKRTATVSQDEREGFQQVEPVRSAQLRLPPSPRRVHGGPV